MILNPEDSPGLNDSKKLTEEQREALFEIVVSAAVSVVAPPSIIVSLNIRGATLWAMAQAVRGLAVAPTMR